MKGYQVSKLFGLTVFVAVFALYLLAFWAVDAFRFSCRRELGSVPYSRLREGQYVYAYVDRIVVHHIKTDYLDSYVGSKNVTLMPSEHYIYTAVLEGGEMVCMAIADTEIVRQLKEFTDGRGERVEVLGQLSSYAELSLPESYYSDVDDFDRSLFLDSVYVKQRSQAAIKAGIRAKGLWGLGMLGLALLLFVTVGGWHRVSLPPFEETREYRDYLFRFSYGMEEELARKKEYLFGLIAKQQGIYKWCLLGGALVLLGNALLLWCFRWILYSSLAYYGLFVSVGMLTGGIRLTWYGFINSDLPLAKRLSECFFLDTISVKREKTSKIIGALSQRLRQEKEGEIKAPLLLREDDARENGSVQAGSGGEYGAAQAGGGKKSGSPDQYPAQTE